MNNSTKSIMAMHKLHAPEEYARRSASGEYGTKSGYQAKQYKSYSRPTPTRYTRPVKEQKPVGMTPAEKRELRKTASGWKLLDVVERLESLTERSNLRSLSMRTSQKYRQYAQKCRPRTG
jgi:hypothetical protein